MNRNKIFGFNQILALFFLEAIVGCCTSTAQAATANWVGNTDANWANTANWTNSQPAGNIATFATAGTSGTTLNNDLAAGTSIGLSFGANASSFVISGNDIVLSGGIANGNNSIESIGLNMTLNTTQNISLGSGTSRLTLGGILSGTGGITTILGNGAGMLVLSGNNSYSGKTTIGYSQIGINSIKNVNGGKSALGAPADTASGTIDLGGGTALIYSGAGDITDRIINLTATGASTATIKNNGSGILKFTSDLMVTTNGSKTFSLAGTGTGEFAGKIVNAADASAVGFTKAESGMWTLSNAANTYSGTTTISGGTLRANESAGLPAGSLLTISAGVFETGVNLVRTGGVASGNMNITAGTSGFSAYGAPVQIAFGTLDTPTALTWGTAPFAPGTLVLNAATANNTLELKNAINLGNSARTIEVDANVATISGIISSTGASGTLTKSGLGTLVLSGANTYTGLTTTVQSGALKVMGATGSLSTNTALFLGVSDTTYVGGSSFIYDNAGASGATAQTLASLASQITQPNDNTVQITRTVAQPVTLAFTAVTLNNTENGNVINFVTKDDAGGGVNGTDYKIVLGGGLSALQGSGGSSYYRIINQNAYFNGGDIAVYDPAGYVRGVNYGVDTNSATSAGTTFAATDNQQITASVSGQGSVTLGSGTTGHNGTLKIVGSSDLTLSSGATLTLSGVGNSGSDGILKTGGGTATISGGSAVSLSNGQADIRVDTASDVLIINMPITLATAVRFLKSGAGTLVLSSGSFSLIGNAAGNNGTTAYVNGGILEIGGNATITPNAANAGTKGAFSLASGARIRYNSTSTSSSIASVIQGQGSVTVSAGTLTLSGANTFTGQLTVEGGALAVATLNNVSASGTLGQSALPVILGKSGGTGTLQYTGGTTNTSKPFILATGGMGAFQIDGSSTTQTLSGVISGGGGLIKSGPGTLSLTATNTYTGDTSVTNGILGIAQANLSTNSTVSVAIGAVLNLNFSGTNNIAALSLGGSVKSSGVYGAATDPAYLGGTGLLKVGSGMAAPKGTLIMVK